MDNILNKQNKKNIKNNEQGKRGKMKNDNDINISKTLGRILRNNPTVLQRYVEALYWDVLIESFYPMLMDKQRSLDLYIPPEIVAKAIKRVLAEETKEGSLTKEVETLQITQVVIHSKDKTIVLKKEEKTR